MDFNELMNVVGLLLDFETSKLILGSFWGDWWSFPVDIPLYNQVHVYLNFTFPKYDLWYINQIDQKPRVVQMENLYQPSP